MEEQFEGFRAQLEYSGAVREDIRSVIADLENATRLMQATILPVHHTTSGRNEVLGKTKGCIPALRRIYARLSEIMKERPGEYYRYHDLWRSQTQVVVFLLAFLYWLDTQTLLSLADAEDHLGLAMGDFKIDIEDYLIGLCNLSNELPRYVVNRVTAEDYDCPRVVSSFLTDLYAAFRILNLRNDVLRKRFDGLKYDVKKVEEVLYDVKIRGLLRTSKNDSTSLDH